MEDRGLPELLSSASSLFSSNSSSSSSHAHKPSHSDVLSSTHILLNAAKAKLNTKSSPQVDIDMGKVAGATGTLLKAAVHYGKLEETRYAKYAHKAEEYLHSYEIKHAHSNDAAAQGAPDPAPAPSAPPMPGHAQGYSASASPQGFAGANQG